MNAKYLLMSIVVLIISSCIVNAEDISLKIKNEDDSMRCGTIKYALHSIFYDNIIDSIYTICYNGNVYKLTTESKGKIEYEYFDGKDYIDHAFSFNKDQIVIQKKYYPAVNDFTFVSISTNPSFRYGRGVSLLKDLKIEKNIATGYLSDNSKVKAYLDPNHGYLAYKLERYGSRKIPFEVINNSNPILIDEKYYIYGVSKHYVNIPVKNKATDKIETSIKILSATYKKTQEKNYLFDFIKSKENIYDFRVGTYGAYYKRSELPKDITSEKLLEMTKKFSEEQEKAVSDSNKQLNSDK